MVSYDRWEDFLAELENATGIKVYDMRTASENVEIPYIVCGRVQSNNFYAENKIWFSQCTTDILLFTYSPVYDKEQKEPVWTEETHSAEKKVEDFLVSKGINYDSDYEWLMSEQLIQTHYQIALVLWNKGDDE